MKKAGYILATLFEIALFVGAYIINYFTTSKMGMARWVVYKNMGWEREYPMDTIKIAAMIVIAILTVLVLLFFLGRRKKAGKLVTVMNLVMVILTVLYVTYTLISSRETMRAYYFLSLMFGLAAAVQIIKTGLAVLLCNKKNYEK